MSGPKCSEWEVERNLRRLEAARQAALAEADEAIERLTQIAAALEATRLSIGASASTVTEAIPARPSRDASMANLEHLLLALRAQRMRIEGQTSGLAAVSRLADMVREGEKLHDAERGKRIEEDVALAGVQRAARKKHVERLLSGLDAVLTSAEQQTLQHLAARHVQASSPGSARATELDLRFALQSAAEAARARAQSAEQAAQLRGVLRGLNGDAVRELEARLTAVERGQDTLSQELRQAVDRVSSEAARASDRQYAMDVLREEFEALGYDVGDEFSTAFVCGGEIVVNRPELNNYAVVLTVSAESREIATSLVRVDEPAMSLAERRLRDKEAEEAWCADFSRIVAGASARKVRTRVIRRVEPGVAAVPLVETRASGRARPGTRRAARERAQRP